MIITQRVFFDATQLAIMGKDPAAAPELAHKRMCILQTYPSAICLADVGDHQTTLNRIISDQTRNLGVGAGSGIMKNPACTTLIKGYPPTIPMRACLSATLHQSGEAEAYIGGGIGAHAE